MTDRLKGRRETTLLGHHHHHCEKYYASKNKTMSKRPEDAVLTAGATYLKIERLRYEGAAVVRGEVGDRDGPHLKIVSTSLSRFNAGGGGGAFRHQ